MSVETEAIQILHVDDEPDFADMAADFLRHEDDRFTVTTATSASEGLERLAEADVDCIVSDYDMPEQTGVEFLETVREEYSDLPFILFTGQGSEEIASEAISAGATDYLRKATGTEQYELLANRIQNAVEQYRATRRATELDRVRTLTSDINQALVRATSRTEIETRVCEILSDSDPYLFAWIGGVDPETNRLEPRASAGIDAGYLGEITVTTDETPTGQGPGGTAIRERRVAVSQNVAEDPAVDEWQEEALDRGYQAIAAVPLEYEDQLYGALGVYSARSNAFDADERALLAELGSDIAHAIHSLEIRDRLREERDQRRALFENAPGPVVAAEIRDGGKAIRIAEISPAFTDVFGYERDEIVGKDPGELIVPEEGMDRYEEFRKRAAAGETITAEVERVTDYGLRTFVLHIIPYGIDGDRADGLYAWFTDITNREKREQAIEELHSTTDALMDAETAEAVAEIATTAVHDILELPANGVHLYDESEDGLVPVAWTARMEVMVGEPPTFAPGEGLAGTAFETGEPLIYDDISTVADRYNPDTEIRSQIVLPLDDYGVLVIGSPEPDDFDDVDVSLAETLAGHATTALERIERETELERYERIVEAMGDGVYAMDAEGRYTMVNDRLLEINGYDRETAIGAGPDLVHDAEDIERFEAAIADLRTDGGDETATVEATLECADGEEVPIEIMLTLLPSEDGEFRGTVGVLRDISERKEREETLERYETIVEATEDQIYTLDPQGRFTYVNESLASFWGYEPEELLGEHVSNYLDDEDAAAGETLIMELLAEDERRSATYELTSITYDGRRIPCENHLAILTDEEGNFRGTLGVVRDISERKEREETLRRQNERLDRFASMVSHDLRNPLNVAAGRVQMENQQTDSDNLATALEALLRIDEIVEDVLTLARDGQEVVDPGRVPFRPCVDAAWGTVDAPSASISVRGDPGAVVADESRLQQLLENLFRNSVEHGGQAVSVEAGRFDAAAAAETGGGFYVEDDGPGIPEDERERIFEYGTSGEDDGTGFGLAIVRQIAEAHGWEVAAGESESGGARFEVTGVEWVKVG